MDGTARALDDAAARIAELEAALATEQARRADVEAERDRLRDAYEALKRDVELARRRLVIAKAERVDTAQLELEFEAMLSALNALAPDDDDDDKKQKKPKTKAKHSKGGRRDLRLCDLPEERVEIADPSLDGKVARIGTEESCELRWRRGGFVRLVLVRFKYDLSKAPKVEDAAHKTEDAPPAGESNAVAAPRREEDVCVPEGDPAAPSASSEVPGAERPVVQAEPTTAPEGVAAPETACPIVTAPMPPRILGRSLATPSLIAHIASDKFCDGLPLHRQEDRFARLGVPLDRGTMSCWLEEVGAIVGVTIVEAMRQEALHTAFCIATDATGVLVQPAPHPDKQRQPCRRAHFFVQIADADHVFFEYTPVETSEVVSELFRDFSGYVQADAKSVFDVLFRPPDELDGADDRRPDAGVRHEVACWSHARTKFWETAVATQDVVAREALARIMRMFQFERAWKDRLPDVRAKLRDQKLRHHVVDFFAFAERAYEKVQHQRGMLRSALGYCVRQRDALLRFLDDGRLEMTNNRSERQLRRVAVGRNNWLFVGSDDHGQAAGHLLTLIASARLHKLDPEVYLRDVFRVLPFWPRERFLELAPRYWRITRARLDRTELDREVGWLTIPESPLPTKLSVCGAPSPAPIAP